MNKLLSAIAATMLLSGTAFAGSFANSGSQSGASANVSTSSGAVSGAATAGNAQNLTYAPTTNYTQPANTTSTVTSGGHLYTTPSVPGSTYFGGANPCLVGYGAGGAGGPVGLSFSFGKNDEGCTRRSDAAAWHALGYDDVAVARMTQDDDNLKAWNAAGHGPLPVPTPVAAAVPAPAPVAAPVEAAAPVAAPAAPHRKVPAWCATAVPGDHMNAAYIHYMCD